jgi:hypothetical protein
MTEDAQKKMAAKVAKLLRLAEHPNTGQAERENATAQAAALMEKYMLDELMVARETGQVVPDKLIRKSYRYKGVYTAADAQLVWKLSSALGMKAIRTKLGSSEIIMNVMGFEKDFERFDTLLASAMLQRAAATTMHISGIGERWGWYTASEKYNIKRSFGIGFADGLGEKVREASHQVQQDVVRERGSGAELMLVDRRKQVDTYYKSLYPGAGKAKPVKTVSSYHAGHRAGRSADVGGTRIGGSRTALPR